MTVEIANERRYDENPRNAESGDIFADLALFNGFYYPNNGEPSAMKRLKPYEFFRLGGIRFLHEIDFEKIFSSDKDQFDNAVITASVALRQFEIRHEQHREFRGTLAQAIELRESLRYMYNSANEGTFKGFMASAVKSGLTKFENILEYDLERLHAYEIEKVGIFDVEDLIDHADDALAPSEKEVLNPLVLQDYRSAGRCLAFDLYTACGFHCMRAVEGAARILYEVLTGRDAQADKKTLGGIAQHLDDEMTEKKYPKDSLAGLVVFNLRRVNNLYRKPIDHPEMSFNSVFEARTAFELTKSAISHVVEAIITCQFKL